MMIMWKQILTVAVIVKMSLTQRNQHSPPLEETHRYVEEGPEWIVFTSSVLITIYVFG